MNFSTSLAFFSWKPAAWLRVSGSDAAGFLQGQFTNELRGIEGGRAVYGLWLNVKGKVLADSFVVAGSTAGEFWVGSYYSPASVIRERLESFVIADDVAIDDATGEWAGLTLLGENAAAALAAETPEGFVFRGRRSRDESVEWVFRNTSMDAVRSRLAGRRELDENEMARRRINAGIPAVPVDVGPGDLPNEGGLDSDAISYTKGCYLGQEVMARLKSMGQVRRRLLRVSGVGENLPALPAALFAGRRRVGELRSIATDGPGRFVGLAMLSLLNLEKEAELAFAPDTTPTVRLVDSP